METLFTTKEDFLSMREAWKSIAGDKDKRTILQSHHYALYSMLRGRNWLEGFAPCTSPRKLASGHKPYAGANRALSVIKHSSNIDSLLAPFGGKITLDMLKSIRQELPDTVQEVA